MVSKHPHSGYVLLLTLTLITLSGLLLTGIARHSLDLSLEARMAQSELQLRWIDISCSRVALKNANEILRVPNGSQRTSADEPASQPKWRPISSRGGTIVLGEYDVQLLVAEESAKVDVNTLLESLDPSQARIAIHRMTRGGAQTLSLRNLPARGKKRQRHIHTWGQLFAPVQGGDIMSFPRGLRESTRELTCWSGGKLNVQSASAQAIHEICAIHGNKSIASQLIAARAENPSINLRTALRESDLDPRDRSKLRKVLTDRPQCYSLWIFSKSSGRKQYQFRIARARNSGAGGFGFTW